MKGKVNRASRSVIAGWIRSAFKEVGINYSPGSIRSAVASSRFLNEIPLDTILKEGNWKGKTNFFKYYYKEIKRSHTNSTAVKLTENTFEPI